MKRTTTFSLLFWLPALLSLVFFWSRHLGGDFMASSVPLLDRLAKIAPGSLWILIAVSFCTLASMLYVWFRQEAGGEIKVRPVFFLGAWLFLVLFMGMTALGDIWRFDLPVALESTEGAALQLREFGLSDPMLVNGFMMFFSLVRHVAWGVGALMMMVLAFLGAGTWFRRYLSIESTSSNERIFLSVGIGAAVWITILTVLGLVGLLVPPLVLGLLVLAVLMALIREGKTLLHILWQPQTLTWKRGEGLLQPIFVAGLLLVTAATFLHVLRPIPIGWDDIGVYMNVPSLTAQHQTLVGGFGTYSWGLIMSLGFLVWQTPYVAMLFSFLGGLLAFWGIYTVLRRVFSEVSPVPFMLTTAFAMSPFVLFQLGEDMKIDLALLFIGSVATLLSISVYQQEKLRRPVVYLLLGLLLGVAFGIKLTAVLLVLFVLGLLLLRFSGGWGITALVSWLLFALFAGNIFAMGGLEIESTVRLLAVVLTAALGVIPSVQVFVREGGTTALKLILLVLLGFIIPMTPWFAFNIHSWCAEGCPPPSMSLILYSKSGQPTLPVLPQVGTGSGTNIGEGLQNELQTTGGTVTEELGRYAGFEQNVMHYLSLPLDASFSLNVSGDYVTVGWVFVTLLLLAAAWGVTQFPLRGHLFLISGLGFFLIFLFVGTFWGGPVVAPWLMHGVTLLIVGVLIASLTYVVHQQQQETGMTSWIRHLFHKKESGWRDAPLMMHIALLVMLYGFLWMYLASGVVWYGIPVILGVFLLGGSVLLQMRRTEEGRIHYLLLVSLLVLFWIVPMGIYKMTTSETSIKRFHVARESLVSSFIPATSFDTRHFLLFKAGVLDQESGLRFFNGEYYAAAKLLNADIEGKVYRVGTLLPYFVASNDTRFASDNQLDQFIASYLPEADPQSFVQRLYDAGFRYIVFDLGTDSIDKTSGKTLTKKVDIFQSFINNTSIDSITEGGARDFGATNNPYLKEELRASSFIIWSLQPQS